MQSAFDGTSTNSSNSTHLYRSVLGRNGPTLVATLPVLRRGCRPQYGMISGRSSADQPGRVGITQCGKHSQHLHMHRRELTRERASQCYVLSRHQRARVDGRTLRSSQINRVRVRKIKKEKYGYYKGRCIPLFPRPLSALVLQVASRSRSLQCSRSFCGHTTTSPASRPLVPVPLYLYPVLSEKSRAIHHVGSIRRVRVRVSMHAHMRARPDPV